MEGSIVRVLPRRYVLMLMTLFLLNTMEPYSAQRSDWGIPSSFTSEFIDAIRERLCDGCPGEGTRCERGMQPTTLCQRACQKEECQNEQCVNNKDLSEGTNYCADSNTKAVCSFEDAAICQYEDETGVCVFGSLPSLCICKNQLGAEDDYQLWTDSCNKEDGGVPIDEGGKINIAVPILSSALAVVLVVLVVVGVVLYRRRNGNSPALLNNKTPNGTTVSTSVEYVTNVSNRLSTPLPLVPGEYPQADNHTYYSLDYNDKGEESPRYVVHGQNSAPSTGADKDPSTEDAYHDYSVLGKTPSNENIVMSDSDCTTFTSESLPEALVETESVRSPVLMIAESETPLNRSGYEIAVVATQNENSSPVHKPTESETANDQSGYEVTVVATQKENNSPVHRPTDSKTTKDQSGYEVAVVATPPADANDSSLYDYFERSTSRLNRSENEIAVVATQKENSSPMHKPAESETANDQSGYEVAVVATPPADASDSSLYDHFERSTSRLTNVSDPSDQENNDYQHLEKV